MPTVLSRHWSALARAARAVGLCALLAGCGDVARLLSPGRPDAGPAHIAVRTSIAAQVGAPDDIVTLRVRSSYLRADGTRVAVGQQLLSLTAAQVQSVPIPVDLATCLADPARAGGADDGCPIVLELALVVNDVVVDQQVIGPLRLAPGVTTNVADPVTLFEITSLSLSRSDGATLEREATLAIGESLALRASLRDARGQPVTDRAVTWTSASPEIVTVDANGVVRAIAPGTTRITVTSGSLSATQLVRVSRPPVELAVTAVAGSGRGTVRSSPAGIDCVVRDGVTTGSCRAVFAADAMVSLTAVADSANRFEGWSDACAGSTTGCAVEMTAARRAGVRFVALRRVRVAAPLGDGRGTVTSEPSGISCRVDAGVLSGSCELDVVDGTVVRLRATADGATTSTPASTFGGWSGACAATASECTVTAGVNASVVRPTFFGARTVSVVLAGTGTGRVTGDGIDCAGPTGRCRVTVAHGSSITLTAVPGSDATFEGWDGCPAAPSTSCTFDVTSNATLSASFAQRPIALTLQLSGSGAGSVRVNNQTQCTLAAGQRLATCTVPLPRGAVVTVSAAAEPLSRVAAVRDACSTAAACTLTMSTARTVSVEFAREFVPVQIVIQGTGTGTVQLAGATTCTRIRGAPPVLCEAIVSADDPRVLRATADEGSEFKGFSAPCGTNPTCTFVPGEPRTVVAVFDEQLVTVEFPQMLGATGRGIVVSTIGPTINCSYAVGGATTGQCKLTAPVGTLVVLRAIPDLVFGSRFDGWTGACDGITATTCSFNLRPTTPATMGARFVQRP